jgi:hypothetical protein
LLHYKQIISHGLYPNVAKDKLIQMTKAKKVIRDYKKAVADPQGGRS